MNTEVIDEQQSPEQVPPARTPGQQPPVLDEAPEGVRRAATGADVTDAEEYDALDWFLGPTQRPKVTVPVRLWTPAGDKTLVFELHAVDGKRIQEIDTEYRDGDGPFATLDKVGFAAALVAESAKRVWPEDNPRKMVDVDSEQFIGGMPGGKINAVRGRFKNQEGLLESLGDRVQDLAGYSRDRVGAASRVLVDAAGN